MRPTRSHSPAYHARVADTIVFIPAWNEERSLPGVLAEAHSSLPEADLLVIDDGSTDGSAVVSRTRTERAATA